MAPEFSPIELFKKGKEFDQIRLLDNFYQIVDTEKEAEEDLVKLLIIGISNSTNAYVKRSAIKILCDLTLSNKVTNRYSTLAQLHDALSSTDSSLQAIALKYLPHFPEAFTDDTKENLKVLSDSADGEVASQAYLCLGLIQLTNGISKTDADSLIANLFRAKPYFQAASEGTENRVDAEFYLLLIDLIESFLAGDSPSVQAKFKKLEKSLQVRCLYEFEESGLALDFLIFKLTQQIKADFDTASTSNEWLEILPQVQVLLNISLETEKIRNIQSKNQGLVKMLLTSTFENVETYIYRLYLVSEKQRFNVLISKSQDSQLIRFVENLLSIFPNCSTSRSENNELLALLSENLGSEEGLKVYRRIMGKEVTLEKAIAELLQKNKNNKLPFRTGSIHGQEVFLSLMSKIDQLLPNYPTEKREAFFNIVEELIRYIRATMVGHEKKRFLFLYSHEQQGQGQKAVEKDLQDSMLNYFEHSKIADGLDHEKAKFVDGGRVDIVYKKDLITIPIELKKSLTRPDNDTLEQNYIAQAQTYTAGYDQLGIFVLMELSDKSHEPQPNFKDWFKVHHLPPSTNQKIEYPDFVISVVIPGNRTTPSAKSTYS